MRASEMVKAARWRSLNTKRECKKESKDTKQPNINFCVPFKALAYKAFILPHQLTYHLFNQWNARVYAHIHIFNVAMFFFFYYFLHISCYWYAGVELLNCPLFYSPGE